MTGVFQLGGMLAVVTPSSKLPGWQLGLRFAIELFALVCWGITGWGLVDSPARVALAVLLPLSAALLWGTFRVPGDESAAGDAPVPVPGSIRLVVECLVLLGAAVAVAATGWPLIGAVLAVLVAVHYACSPGRIRWLWARRAIDQW